ncbi:MAG: hypothetical protein V2B15_05460 [Bacteroidota bacterium]
MNTSSVPIILLVILVLSGKCQGEKTIYIVNCSNDVAIVKSSSSNNRWQQAPIENYNDRTPDLHLKSSDTIFPMVQIDYFRSWYDTKGKIDINGDTISIMLEPGESMRIAYSGWIFFPGRIREPSLDVDNLMIITKSDTFVTQNRKEILRLQKDKRFRYDRHYKNKVGPNTRQKRKILIK